MVTNIVNSVRYGNLAAKIDKINNPEYKTLTGSINRMIETLNDREKMIIEYQTELMRQNERLESVIDSEREIKTLKEDFAAALTHDLKVPIIAQTNVVSFFLDEKFGSINEKQKAALKNMQTSGRELINLVEILLETYKIQEHGIPLEKEEIQLNGFIEEIVRAMQPIAENSGITTDFIAGKDKKISADSLQLERVIKNLISNAVSHSGTKKNIEIKTGGIPGFVTISVIDYGQGISAGEIEMIFDKYYCANKKFRKIGTGLGLYLSQQIMLAHGGEITVNSEENVRTEFCIKLPE
jgi:two-component system NarL family sensor kinase